MPDRDAFADRERAIEEAYFLKKEQELIEKLRRRAALEAERRKIAEELGVIDQEVIEALQDLGFTRETMPLLPLAPLVQVAWAEGGVTQRERELIFEIARSRGITAGSPADQRLTEWLDHKPSDEFFDSTLLAIRIVNQTLPPEQQTITSRDLLTYCASIAEASGGILGLGNKISEEERRLLAHIATELAQNREGAVKQVLEKS
jgi:hypothetical protein